MATVFEVTRVHAATLALTRPILNAAATSDQIDHDVFAAQLDTQLAAGSAAWHTLHGVVRDLIEPGSRRMDPALRIAGSELLASLSEIVLDGTTIATPAAIIMRATPETVPALTEALATHHEMSAVVLDTLTHPGLRVDARAAQDYLHASVAFATDSDVGSPSRAWIDPHDLAARRQISLPQPLRADLCRLAHQANATTASLAESPAVRPARAQTPGPAESCSPARLRFPRLTAAPPRGPQAVTRSR
ncbi:MAG: hypothetical protein IE926_09905 [Micrococcales bacterium]|nr:hypothetical protein [Micrococcales bacterium]